MENANGVIKKLTSLRNVVPRQGTERTEKNHSDIRRSKIEKCSSPTGDGKIVVFAIINDLRIIEKCSSPTGDGKVEITRESRSFDN